MTFALRKFTDLRGLGLLCVVVVAWISPVFAQEVQVQVQGQGVNGPFRDPVTKEALRNPDRRLRPDPAKLEVAGIGRYTSKRLDLYTDLPAEIAATLPPLMDQVYAHWEAYFGPMAPDAQRSEYQMTGFIFRDESRFQSAGLIPEGLLNYRQGRHRGAQFWMADVESDYYRRHLMIHEATHCFMTAVPYANFPPTWYLEGMAELFATHRVSEDGTLTCCVFPDRPENFRGLGRIETIQDEVRAGRQLNLIQANAFTAEEFAGDRKVPYAWSWALCAFFDGHPHYRDQFRALGKNLEGEVFQLVLAKSFQRNAVLLGAEFFEFGKRITHGYDFGRNAFAPSNSITTLFQDSQFKVRSNTGWQSTGLQISPGQLVELTASGSVELSQAPAPWRSEPQGLSIRYCVGQPIGILLGGLLPAESAREAGEVPSLLVGVVANGTTLTVDRPSILYFRVNEFANEMAGNIGEYSVTIHPLPRARQ